MTESIYCTVIDANFVGRALALQASLNRENSTARFAFFCIDDRSAELLERLDLARVSVVRHAQFSPPELARLCGERTRSEYCWTCKPFALRYLAGRHDTAWVVYLDSDMMFFGDPDEALPDAAAHYLLTPHRFHPAFERFAGPAGDYNAGYFAARASSEGCAVLDWWADRCLERCSAIPVQGSYADQKYLDQLPALFPAGAVSAHPGLNAAPWNIERYTVRAQDGRVYVDGAPLLLFHFQGLKLLGSKFVDVYAGNRRVLPEVQRLIYVPYLEQLSRAYDALRALEPDFDLGLGSLPRTLTGWMQLAVGIARGNHNLVRYRV